MKKTYIKITVIAILLVSIPTILMGITPKWTDEEPGGEFNNLSRLYTKPDPMASGGIRGRISMPVQPFTQILAVPPDEPRCVYVAKKDPEDPQAFEFYGLPMRKYDLIVIYEKRWYEGLQLTRGDSTLTKEDLKKIQKTVDKMEPFFNSKTIHRVEGITGKGNDARVIVNLMRDKPIMAGAAMATKGDMGRIAYKILMMKDVGPGWQIARAREVFSKWMENKPEFKYPKHHYNKKLSKIRVSNKIKDVGDIDLSGKK